MRFVRKTNGLSQVDFASSLGITQGFLSGLETGRNQPTADMLTRMANIYQTNINWLLTGEENTGAGAAENAISDEDPAIAELLEGARRVLKSGNPIAFDALERNIRYFDHAVASEKRLLAVEAKLEELMKVLSERQKTKKAANDK